MFAQSRSKITFVCLHLPNFQLFSETIVNEGSKDQQAKPLEELKCNLKCFELFICVKGSGRISLEFIVPGGVDLTIFRRKGGEKKQNIFGPVRHRCPRISQYGKQHEATDFCGPQKRNCSTRDFWETETDLNPLKLHVHGHDDQDMEWIWYAAVWLHRKHIFLGSFK